MLAILKREIKSYFQNVIGWLFVGAILAVYGVYFFAYNLQNGYPYISYPVSSITFVLLIAVPILSMRCLAEERKSKVDQLLLTAPVTVGKIVLAKYLAMVAVFSVAVGIIALTPLLLSMFGTVPMGESYVAVLGFWLMGCLFLAVGLFLSSITESQVIAAVLSFVVLFLCYMMDGILSLITENETIVTKILSILDIYTPFIQFMNGNLDLSAVFYYISTSAFMVFLAAQSLQKRRWDISKNTFSTSVFSTTTITIGLAVTVAANLVISSLPVTMTKIDCSYGKIYDLTEDTELFLKDLEDDITIYVLSSEASKDVQIDETLQRYAALSSYISVEYVDPATNPYFYQTYTDSIPSQNSVIVEGSERSKLIDYYDLYEVEYEMNYYTYSYTTTITGYDAEGQITSAIEYVTMPSEELAVVYQITGHGEMSLSSAFTEVLEKANIRLESLELFQEDAVPEDAQVVIINAPTVDFNTEDAQKIINYMENGGNAIIVCDFEYADLTNFNSIVANYGLEWVDGIVAENNAQYYYSGNPFYLLPDVNSTAYTSSISGSYVLAAYSVGITYPEDVDGIAYESMLETTDEAVSKTNLENITTSQYEEGDIAGEFSVAVAATKSIDEETISQMVVLGSSMILTDETNAVVSGNHAAMFTSIISEMTTESSLTTSVIPAKELTLGTMTIPTMTSLTIAFLMVLVLPLSLLGYGVFVWYIRRKK